MQCRNMNETFGSCRPWAHDNLLDNLNILNNFKHNLNTYENVYKKYSVKTRPQLPQIRLPSILKSRNADRSSKMILEKLKNKTLESNSNIPKSKEGLINKSMELQASRSQLKLVKTTEDHKRGQTSMQMVNKQNKQIKEEKQIVTQRGHYNPNTISKVDMKNKVCLISFDDQYKYRRLRKRELHQIIFGSRQKIIKRQLAILR